MNYSFFDESNDNLVALYVLPFLNISYRLFGNQFRNAKITRDLDAIFVYISGEVSDQHWDNPFFQNDYSKGRNMSVLVYSVPKIHELDLKKFSQGRYSELSNFAKNKIKRHSGLAYEKIVNGTDICTDMKLLVLDKHEVLLDWIKENYGEIPETGKELIQLEKPDRIFINE